MVAFSDLVLRDEEKGSTWIWCRRIGLLSSPGRHGICLRFLLHHHGDTGSNISRKCSDVTRIAKHDKACLLMYPFCLYLRDWVARAP